MSQLMEKAGVGAGVAVSMLDGTIAYTDASGIVTVPDDSVTALINDGWQYAATNPGPESEANSSAVSAAGSSGTRASVANSIGLSAGARASMAFSLAAS